MPAFTLTIHSTGSFGERADQEQRVVAEILMKAAHHIGTGHAPIPIKDGSGNHVATFSYGLGMLNRSDAAVENPSEPRPEPVHGLHPRDFPIGHT